MEISKECFLSICLLIIWVIKIYYRNIPNGARYAWPATPTLLDQSSQRGHLVCQNLFQSFSSSMRNIFNTVTQTNNIVQYIVIGMTSNE